MKNKFTLIELLVVVAIMGILVSILLPSLSRTREKARRAVCASNMNQQMFGITKYAQDNRQKLLPGYRYRGSANDTRSDETWALNADTYESYRDQYMGGADEIFSCVNMQPFNMPQYHHGTRTLLLGMNFNFNKPGINAARGTEFPSGSLLQVSSTVPLISDLNNWTTQWKRTMVAHTATGGFMAANWNNGVDGGQSAMAAGSEGGNFAYVDGSVIWKGIEKLDTFQVFSWGEGLDLLPKDIW